MSHFLLDGAIKLLEMTKKLQSEKQSAMCLLISLTLFVHVCFFVCLCLSVCLSLTQSGQQFVEKSTWFPLIMFDHISSVQTNVFRCVHASLWERLSVCLSISPSVCPSVCLSVRLSVRLSIRSERFLVKAVSVWRLHFWQTTWKLAYRCILTSSIDF